MTALYTETAQAASPAAPYTITARYSPASLGPIDEDTLALHRWDGQQWLLEPGSSLDTAGDAVSAAVTGLGTFALRGEVAPGRIVYLPFVQR